MNNWKKKKKKRISWINGNLWYIITRNRSISDILTLDKTLTSHSNQANQPQGSCCGTKSKKKTNWFQDPFWYPSLREKLSSTKSRPAECKRTSVGNVLNCFQLTTFAIMISLTNTPHLKTLSQNTMTCAVLTSIASQGPPSTGLLLLKGSHPVFLKSKVYLFILFVIVLFLLRICR